MKRQKRRCLCREASNGIVARRGVLCNSTQAKSTVYSSHSGYSSGSMNIPGFFLYAPPPSDDVVIDP